MYILSFVKPVAVKFKTSISTKIVIIQIKRNQSDFHLEMVVFGPGLRLP